MDYHRYYLAYPSKKLILNNSLSSLLLSNSGMTNLSRVKLVFLLLMSSNYFNFPRVLCSETPGIQSELRDFVPLPPREEAKPRSDSMEYEESTSSPIPGFEEILADESVSLELNCERTLGSREEALRSFVMKSLDLDAESTLNDLERPSCRALFDRNAHFFNKDQLSKLISTERGLKIVREGDFMEFFADFSDFTLADFDLFPDLKIGRIRNLNSIPAPVLLELVKQRGFANAGKLERIPEAFGDRVLDHLQWKSDPEIWQLFTIEGIVQVKNSFSLLVLFSKFIAAQERFQNILFANSTSFQSPDATSPSTLTPVCKAMIDNSKLISRWIVQSEEFLLYLMELPEAGRVDTNNYITLQTSVEILMKTRVWLSDAFKTHCREALGSSSISETESMHLASLKGILELPITWRLREALLLRQRYPLQLPDARFAVPTLTPMTQILYDRLPRFRPVCNFFAQSNQHPINNDRLLTHFVLLNGITHLDEIFSPTPGLSIPVSNEKFVLAIAIRRILLLLLSPTLESHHAGESASTAVSAAAASDSNSHNSGNVIQDFLNYVFSSQSSSNTETLEIQRWFRHARDLSAVPVLDRLIQVFGHEINVAVEIHAMLDNQEMRMKLFTESKSAYVHLLAVLSSQVTLLEHLVQASPKVLVMPFLDPAQALLKLNVPDLVLHPKKQAHSPEELREHELQVEGVTNYNAAISEHLNTSLCFLNEFVSKNSNDFGLLTPSFSIFIQPNFQIQYQDKVGVDVGGLRRTWLSALLRSFGDPQRHLFPMHEDDGERTPAALLDPEIMGHLGALHGKALQVGVKPDWFFTRTFAKNFLFAEGPSAIDSTAELDETFLTLVESWYPDIFKSFELILNCGDNDYAVEYFNSSNFPTIEALSNPEQPVDPQPVVESNLPPVESSISDPPAVDPPQFAVRQPTELPHPQPLNAPSNSLESSPEFSSNFSSNSPILVLGGVNESSDAPVEAAVPADANAVAHSNAAIDDQSVTSAVEEETVDGDDNEASDGLSDGELFENEDTRIAGADAVDVGVAPAGPPRHSFSRLLVFDARYLSRKDIYNGPSAEVESIEEITAYRRQLVELFARNLLIGRQKYWQTFGVFFDDRFRDLLTADFLHGLLQPPEVTIDQIISRIHFNRSCDSIFVIDDDGGEEEGDEGGEKEDEKSLISSGEEGDGECEESSRLVNRRRPSPKKRLRLSRPSSPRRLANITAKQALQRILSTSFTDRESIKSLLSFATGCPQVPPAGLDALRLVVECQAAAPPRKVLSKTQTCFNSINFVVSLKYRETKGFFIRSALESSGFGFN